MNFNQLFESLLSFEAQKLGSKFGDHRDYDPKFYPELRGGSAPSTNQAQRSVIGTEPTGPIIVNGYVLAKRLNNFIEEPRYKQEFERGPGVSQVAQSMLTDLINKWLAGEQVMRLDEPKHTLKGGGRIWDASHRHPSIKVRLDIDGVKRTLAFRNVWWTYGSYVNNYIA